MVAPGRKLHRSATSFATTTQKTARVMTCKNDGELAVVVVDSHGHERGHASPGSMGDADSAEDGNRGDGEPFFQCVESSGAALADEVFPGGSEDEEGDDVRHSFATAVDDRASDENTDQDLEDEEEEDMSRYDYGMWMEPEPMSIQERRRRLLHGMGLTSSRDLLRSRNARARLPPDIPRCAPRRQLQPAASFAVAPSAAPAKAVAPPETAVRHQPSAACLTRCRSDSRLAARGGVGRKPPALRRVSSLPDSLHGSPVQEALRAGSRCPPLPSAASKDDGNCNGGDKGSDIKNVGNRKEFMVNDKLNELPSVARMSVDEFMKRFIGHTQPVTTQPMRRTQSQPVPAPAESETSGKDGAKPAVKRRTRWLKNIKLVASAAGFINEKDKQDGNGRSPTMSKSASASGHSAAVPSSGAVGPERLKVHHYGTSSKELTGLYIRQEVRAHEGSIWTMKFSPDGRLLATGGEDHVVRVWRVVDADAGVAQELSSASLPPATPLTPAATEGRSGAPVGLAAQLSRKVRRGKSSKHVLPEHVVVPEFVFALAEEPACALEGHQDDVLDLSWSKSQQQLLSSSMDKTVRLWDVDTQTCLKLFAHNDYVTCVQFNPVDDDYFISGSLDSKVRIWSVPERQVVDWSDLNDMVTAACYTPDGQAAMIGSHKGSCRFYKTTDCKLNQEAQIDMNISKKRKSQAKKITGFQFAPGNPSEILVTSADSQIRVFNGITVLQKFKGFKNTSSQISASYTADGRYVVCASEDSHVYLWRRCGVPGGGGGVGAAAGIGVRAKTWLTSRSYEYFFCRDVSVAVPWPGSPSLRCASSRSSSSARREEPPRKQGSVVDDAGSGVPSRTRSGPMTYTSSARWHGGAEGGNAWGLVVVTASRGGEIRVYQNFGLPVGIRGQSTQFSGS